MTIETRLVTDEDLIELHPKFKILRQIAHGGMGAIYLAEQLGVHGFRKVVVIKRLRHDLLDDEESLQPFVGEAKLVADLLHEHIVQVYHLDRSASGELLIVMEYVAGRNLCEIGDRLSAHGRRLAPELAAFVVSCVCRGLAYAHRKRDVHGQRLKIVHRDISPSNLMVSFGGVVKLLDFGIAKALTVATPDEREVIMGKFPYMAPELARYEGTDDRSDIFSLGLVFHELLTGRMVIQASSRDELLQRLSQPIPLPSDLNHAVPVELDRIVMRAVALDPDERWQSAEQMGRAIEQELHGPIGVPNHESLSQLLAELFPESRRFANW